MKKSTGIIEYINQYIDDAESKTQPFVVAGILNREYLRGHQYKSVDTTSLIIKDRKQSNKVYMERKAFNRMLPIYLTRYGILSSNRPIPGFKSSSTRASSVTGALEGNEFLAEFSKEVGIKAKYNELVRVSDSDGLGWIKVGIDWTKGDLISVKEVKIKNNDTEVISDKLVKIREGRPFLDIIPIHEVYLNNLNVTSPDKINEIALRRPFSCDFIEKRFGYRPKKEEIIGQMSAHPYYLDIAMSVTGQKSNEFAFVKEYYKAPDALYPKGRFVLTTGDRVLYDGILPYENGPGQTRRIPFIPVSLQTIPGHIVGPTVYNQIIPMQDTYNSVKNRLLEYVNHLAIGQLYYWEGSLVNKNSFTNKPGRMIALKRNARAPAIVQKDRIGVEIVTYLNTVEQDMLITAGLSQLQAYGMSKSNMRTDGVVDKIADSDANKLSIAIDNLSEGLIDAFKQVVYLEKYRQRILQQEYEVDKADNYMLKYKLREVDPEELEIINREFLVNSDIALEKKVMQASNLGLYNPQMNLSYRTKREMLDAINSGYLKDTLDPTERSNFELSQSENEMFLELKQPIVESFQDHDLHILEHNLFRLSPLLQKLKSTDKEQYDKVRSALDDHVAKHQGEKANGADQSKFQNAKAYL